MQQKWNQNFDGETMTDIPQKFLNAGCDVYMVMQLRHARWLSSDISSIFRKHYDKRSDSSWI